MADINELKWDKFAGNLLGYITEGQSKLIKTDYEIKLDIPMGDIIRELQNAHSISDLSPQLQELARQYESTLQ